MKKIVNYLIDKARQCPLKIIFPEYQDRRIIEAASIIEKEGIALPIILDKSKLTPSKKEEFSLRFYERRKHKGLTLEEAREKLSNPLYYGLFMLGDGEADCLIAGAETTTGDVARGVIHCLKREANLISTVFIISTPSSYGEKGVLFFSDCAINPFPQGEELAAIALNVARFVKETFSFHPRLAFLSFSTKGSGKTEERERIKKAIEIFKSKEPNFSVDGELQADAALVPSVAERKIKQKSPVAGCANILIFPNLSAGNISYKLLQRLSKIEVIGPLFLGTQEVVSDLSRGCEIEDIVYTAAAAVVYAQNKRKSALRR